MFLRQSSIHLMPASLPTRTHLARRYAARVNGSSPFSHDTSSGTAVKMEE